MNALQPLRYEIAVAQGEGKTPRRWIIRNAALPAMLEEAERSGLTADPAAEAGTTLLGLPYEIGDPANGRDAELICEA